MKQRTHPSATSPVAHDKIPGWSWAWGALLVLLVLIVYWPTWRNGFISDDSEYVVNNGALHSLEGLYNLWFKLGTIQQYYPLVFTNFWIEYHLWGLDACGYHVINALLHATSAVLVWRVLDRLAVPGAWLAAAIFAVHPVEVESVAWISERKNVLSCALALGSMLAYWRFSPPQGATASRKATPAPSSWDQWGFYLLALVLYVGALLSKSVTASLPAVLLVICWWKQGKLPARDLKALAPFFATGVGLGLLTVWMEKVYVGAEGDLWNFTPIDRLLIAGRAVWFYAAKLAWPHPLMFFYPRWTIDSRQFWQYLFPLAAVALLIGLWWARRWIGRGPLAAALIFGGVLVPAIGFFDVFPFRFSFVADHYQYHASIALIALASAGAVTALEWLRPHASWPPALVALALLTPLAIVAHQKTKVYYDDYTLNLDVAAQYPESWVAANNLAGCLLAEGKYEDAVVLLRKAIQWLPNEPVHHGNLAFALIQLKRFDEAAAELDRAFACKLNRDERGWLLQTRGVLEIERHQPDAALEMLNAALALRSDWNTYLHRARAWAIKQEHPNALRDAQTALQMRPTSAEALELHATLLQLVGKHAEALAEWEKLRRLMPSHPSVLSQIAACHLALRQWSQAIATYDQLLALNAHDARALEGRAESYANWGQHSAAVADYERAIQLDSQNQAARNNLAWLLATSPDSAARNGQRAIELAQVACDATQYRRPEMLGTLAAAHAEAGQFDRAASWANKAMELSDGALKQDLLKQLQSYERHEPWREAPGG